MEDFGKVQIALAAAIVAVACGSSEQHHPRGSSGTGADAGQAGEAGTRASSGGAPGTGGSSAGSSHGGTTGGTHGSSTGGSHAMPEGGSSDMPEGGTGGAVKGGSGGTVEEGGAPAAGTGGSTSGDGGAAGDEAAGAGGAAGSPASDCPDLNLGEACGLDSPPAPACVDGPERSTHPELIDDFEDRNTCLRFVECRRGFWFGFDAGGWQTPELLLDADRGSRVLRESGEISDTNGHWGLALWPSATNYCNESAVDLSAYDGISFWAKNVTGAAMRFTVRDDITHTGQADEGETSPTAALSLSTDWAFYQVHWSELLRPSDDTPADPTSLRILKWEGDQVNASYELLLDDVALFND